MEPTPPGPLPSEVDRRLAALEALTGAERVAAIEQLYRDFPAHAKALAARLAPDHSHVVTGGPVHAGLLERLRALGERGPAARRYEVQGEVARGGMGVILRAFDQDLGRSLAMKVILGRSEGGAETIDPQVLERFVEEAQITGQLDHPGVVPVHELGLDDHGRVYFTMRLVRGRTAQEVFDLARTRAEHWTPTRALEVLLKVCDTLAYAHNKGVVHRDLKPSNVMVGRYGEVYVMDWGLAKVLGKDDTRDLRIRPQEATTLSRVQTDRSKEHESDPDTALRTMDGAIVGTPCYMPPEQANGQVEEVGIRSDVYAAGAMLYSLLTGVQPYLRPGSKTSPYMILEYVRQGPPAKVLSLDPKAPPELVAICERAMARSPEQRYPSMEALADDLRAYLEGRVVRAYRTGSRAELAAWVRRHRGMAAGLVAAVLSIVAGGVWALVYARQADAARIDARSAQRQAEQEGVRANAARAEAEGEQRKTLAALEAAQAEQLLRENAESDLRQERAGLLQQATRLQLQLEATQKELQAVQSELHAKEARRSEELQAFRTFEPSAAIDRYLEDSAAAVPVPAVASKYAAALDAVVTRADAETAANAVTLFRASECLVRREPAAALALLAESIPDPACKAVGARLQAIAHWQLGDRDAALAAYQQAAPPKGVPLFETGAAELWHQRNQREVMYLLLDACETSSDVDSVRRAAATWLEHVPAPRGLPEFVSLPALLRGFVHGMQGTAAELRSYVARQQGRPGQAALLDEKETDATVQANIRFERARCHLALHEPLHALAELREGTRGCVFEPQLRHYHELQAASHFMLGDLERAEQALAAALAATPARDRDNRDRLACDRASVLRRLGRPRDALLQLDELAAAGASGASVRALTLMAALARQLDQPEPTASLVTAAGVARADASIQQLLFAARRALLAGDREQVLRALERAKNLLASVDAPLLRAEQSVLAAEAAAAAAGDTSAALRALDHAALALQQWLLDYGRFRGGPVSAHDVDVLADLAATAADGLARAASAESIDLDAAWRVVATFHDPLSVAFGTRTAALPGQKERVGQYETARANWLERLHADPEGLTAEQRKQLEFPVVTAADMARLEDALRAGAGPLSGALLPRVPPLMAVRALLPHGTCLVVFGVGRAHVVAFVAAREGAELIAIDDPAPRESASPAHRLRRAAAILGPVLRGRLLRETAQWRRLLLAPTGPLHELPFELATSAEPDSPLLVRAELARVPSAAAWFEHASEPPPRRREQPSAAVFAAGTEAEATPWRELLATAVRAQSIAAFAGPHANAKGLESATTRHPTCLVLSLPLAAGHPTGLAALRLASDASPDPASAVTLQRLRDLETPPAVAILRATDGAPPGTHSEALAQLVRGLWARGCRTVVTITSAPALADIAPLLAAVVAAAAHGQDPVAAWTGAARRAIEQGTPAARLAGVQLWSSQW